ncbi:MAG TPA: DUF1460 domain-containing protein [Bacteroidetes bacterium]|nr:DUF1460 domain-containing protein [Bacteroidota bacterium]
MIRRPVAIVSITIALALAACAQAQTASSVRRVDALVALAKDSGWTRLPIGQLMTRLGLQLLTTPYVGGTLEGDGPEVCRISLDGLDCVTFFESVLNLARNIQRGRTAFEDLRSSVTETRYRSGILDGYTSRLHYTTEWFLDNVAKGVVEDVSQSLGGTPMNMKVDFMSTHPQLYPALRQDTAAVRRIAEIERRLQRATMFVIARDRIARIESELKDGDIIAIVTSKKGLDYAHTGIVVREGNRARLMHASSTKKQVILDGYLADVVARVDSWTGVSVARPQEAVR